jgi:hypothetical protein
MERAMAGEIEDLDAAILDAIEAWHVYQPTIPEDLIGENVMTWLGMSWNEYSRWVKHPEQLKYIIWDRIPKIGMQINRNDAIAYELGAAIDIEVMNKPFICHGKMMKGLQEECKQSKTALRISIATTTNIYSTAYYCESCMIPLLEQMNRIPR